MRDQFFEIKNGLGNLHFPILAATFQVEYKLSLAGSVAQSVEQRPFKALVPGSSPGRPMKL